MKKIVYSFYTKMIVCILCIGSLLYALNIGLDGMNKWNQYKTEVYHFEDHFEDSQMTYGMLSSVELDMYYAVADYLKDNENIKERLDETIDYNQVDCYLAVDDKVVINTIKNIEDYSYYSIVNIKDDGQYIKDIYPEEHNYVHYDTEDLVLHKVDMKIALKDHYVQILSDLWDEQKVLAENTIENVVIGLGVSVLSFLYLVIVCGQDKEGNKKCIFIDRMYIEVNLLFMTGLSVFCLELMFMTVNQFIYGDLSYKLMKIAANACACIYVCIMLVLVLSIVRIIKSKELNSHMLINKALRFVYKMLKVVLEQIGLCFSNYITFIVIIVLFIYTACIGYFGHESYYNGRFVLFGIGLFLFVGYFVMRYLNDLDKIKKGIGNIKEGDIDYKIGNIFYKDLNILKDNINDISLGLKESLNQSLKAERLKTELITNVSHDLKTPLTSIITYTQLLTNRDDLPEEAKDYISIIDKKGQRLKVLTQDLFDIAKVQSGNEEIVLEKLNVETLISQSLAEYEQELQSFTLCTNIEDNLYIYSDGKKMSRVINNLLVNVIKYTLTNTRVFIDAKCINNKVRIEIKNLSSYPLDFDKDEIMNRFVRGDQSRSEEGHGLGLAIVKSYVEVTGGYFDIVLDGDMFKAIIEYDKQ